MLPSRQRGLEALGRIERGLSGRAEGPENPAVASRPAAGPRPEIAAAPTTQQATCPTTSCYPPTACASAMRRSLARGGSPARLPGEETHVLGESSTRAPARLRSFPRDVRRWCRTADRPASPHERDPRAAGARSSGRRCRPRGACRVCRGGSRSGGRSGSSARRSLVRSSLRTAGESRGCEGRPPIPGW